MTTENKHILNYCFRCSGLTNHTVLFKKAERINDPDYHYESIYFVVQCDGCNSISYRLEGHDYENSYPDENDNWIHDISVSQFPSFLKNHKPLEDQYFLPTNIKIVYKESINALKSNCPLLAAVGFRAVVEAICLDKNIAGRNLEIKIDNLCKNRLITDKESERLHAVRFMGNDSVHEMAVPKENALYVVLEVIEHLLNNLYIIDEHTKPVLDTFIQEFEDFEILLIKKIKKLKQGDDFPLAKILEKDIRRLNGQISKFETHLIGRISSGDFTQLKVGALKPFGVNSLENHQHFIRN